MDKIVLISHLLADLPAFTQVAVVYCASATDNFEGLLVRYADGTESGLPVPNDSRDYLKVLFPRMSRWVGPVLDADYNVYTCRLSISQDALVTYTHSRELCARLWGIVQ